MQRFWDKVSKSSRCWIWQAAHSPKGYGLFLFDGRMQGAHRVAWQLEHGAIPDGAMILHRCDNPPCVRLEHLFLGNASVNTLDAIAKGRWVQPTKTQTHCKRGHALTGDNLVMFRGERHDCKECHRQRKLRYKRSNKPSN